MSALLRPALRTGSAGRPTRRPFEYTGLPDPEKQDLCERLLSEHGVDVKSVSGEEIVVACQVSDYHRDQDLNPTGALNYSKLVYNCLGCGASGGLLWFIATLRGCTVEEARAWLDGETGLGGSAMELSRLVQVLDAMYAPRKRPPPIPTYGEKMLEPWAEIHPYLTETWRPCRGVPYENAERFRCGYAPEYVLSRWPDGSPRQTGERIILPHFWQGSLVGWQHRRIYDDGTPKFKSTPEFPKDRTIFNYDRWADEVVVVEAMLSTIKHDGAPGVPHMESTFGAEVTDTQRSLLAQHRRVVLWMDNDNGGWNAVRGLWKDGRRGREVVKEGLGDYLAKYTNVYVVENPYAADPADMTAEDVARLIDSAVPYLVWQPPRQLLCYRCGNVNERGHDCVAEEDRDD